MIRFWIPILSTAVLSSQVLAGGYSGTGGDLHDISDGAAWFLGSAPVTYCIDVGPHFGKSANEVQVEFESAAKTWRSHILERQVHQLEPTQNQLNLNFQYSGVCQGTEDLSLIMGLEPKKVVDAKSKFEKPFAFAIRETYNPSTRRGHGFVWIADTGAVFPKSGSKGFPNWSQEFTLRGVLLHELGHILGIGHVEGTIMEENMLPTLQLAEGSPALATRAEYKLTHIEDQKILDREICVPIERDGTLSYMDSSQANAVIFKTFTGKDPLGKTSARLELGDTNEFFKLTLFDASGARIFMFEPEKGAGGGFDLASGIFKISYAIHETSTTTTSLGMHGFSKLGTFTAMTGEKIRAQIFYNSGESFGPFHIKYYDGTNWRPMFYSKLGGT